MGRSATHQDSHLTHEDDNRNKYDSGRLNAFNGGWTDGITYREGGDPGKYSKNPALTNVTWHNLGFRLGAMFGRVGDDLQERMYEWCKDEWDYKEQRGLVTDDK